MKNRRDKNDKKTLDYHIDFIIISTDRDREAYFYKAYSVQLPSGDEGQTRFSQEFCDKFLIHKPCGRARPDPAGYHGEWHYKPCEYCASASSGRKFTKKRSFDDSFKSCNK
jgi:hypothetical protein